MITKKTSLEIVASSMGESGVASCELRYDGVNDPLAVHLAFTEEDFEIEVTWIVGRDLLLEGIDATAYKGQGDMRIRSGFWKGQGAVFLSLRSPDGTALLSLPRKEVKDFLGATRQAVPTGAELVNGKLDQFLAGLPATVEEFDAQQREAEDRAREGESE